LLQDFLIDARGGRLAVVTSLGDLIPKERVFFIRFERHKAQFSHSPAGYHSAREPGSLHEIILCAGGYLTEDNLLRGATTQHQGEPSLQTG
jgi:hypothetical protein